MASDQDAADGANEVVLCLLKATACSGEFAS
ncbi:hypothetical protein L915_04786 [Phytophthora nicotianae]|uniref:Uncharacterized protein n=1 Tax=Phytophthora nicotianae TaxID=4792 RepID=W2HB22_PHYNI|nr:hypothetical protein L915_04786 [Phytophthora nicotianae]ETL45111.1 hypothetical protein L916_04732 [Phytophthora nicotianae]